MGVLVTGGSGALGGASCRALAAAGHAVAVGYHTNRDAAERVVGGIRSGGGRAVATGFDVSDATATEAAVARVAEAWGGLEVLVHAAGQTADGLVYDLGPDDVHRVFSVNVAGALHCVRAALPWFLLRRQGRIILFSSVLASRAGPGVSAYASTKGAIEAMTRALAVELGPKGITVNAVAPGYVDAGLGRAPVASAGAGLRKLVPLRRPGTCEEVAATVAFLASAASSYVTGSVIRVDGGLLAGGHG